MIFLILCLINLSIKENSNWLITHNSIWYMSCKFCIIALEINWVCLISFKRFDLQNFLFHSSFFSIWLFYSNRSSLFLIINSSFFSIIRIHSLTQKLHSWSEKLWISSRRPLEREKAPLVLLHWHLPCLLWPEYLLQIAAAISIK